MINAAHLAPQLVAALGDGAAFGVRIAWSLEPEPLETAGGIATAMPWLPAGPVLVVSGDIWTRFDYASLAARVDAMARDVRAAARPPRDGAEPAVSSVRGFRAGRLANPPHRPHHV